VDKAVEIRWGSLYISGAGEQVPTTSGRPVSMTESLAGLQPLLLRLLGDEIRNFQELPVWLVLADLAFFNTC